MTLLKLYDERDYLTIMDLLKQGFRGLVEEEGQIYWNRQGQWRRIPNAILQQELGVYDMWTQARPDKWTMKPPATVGLIFWDQGFHLDKWDLPGNELSDKQARIGNEPNNSPD
jgi:hypothetical protein